MIIGNSFEYFQCAASTVCCFGIFLISFFLFLFWVWTRVRTRISFLGLMVFLLGGVLADLSAQKQMMGGPRSNVLEFQNEENESILRELDEFDCTVPQDELIIDSFAYTNTNLALTCHWTFAPQSPNYELSVWATESLTNDFGCIVSKQVCIGVTNDDLSVELPCPCPVSCFLKVVISDDTDGDDLDNYLETLVYHTDVHNPDSDGDGFSDSEELGCYDVVGGGDFLWFDISGTHNYRTSNGSTADFWTSIWPGFRVCSNSYNWIQMSLDGFLNIVPDVNWPQGQVCEWRSGDDIRWTDFSKGAITVMAFDRDLCSTALWDSGMYFDHVTTNGLEYDVFEWKNIGLASNFGTASPLATFEVILPVFETNVVYVSYLNVDDGFQSEGGWIGVQDSSRRHAMFSALPYSVICQESGAFPKSGTTARYFLGQNSHPLRNDSYVIPELPVGANSNAYYTIDVHAVNDTVEVQFVGDAPSNLEDPRFLLRGGESRRVLLLMGKTYVVNATGYIECDSPSDAEVLINATSSNSATISRPVIATASGVGRFEMTVSPENLGGTFVWDGANCCNVTDDNGGYVFCPNAGCGCVGCLASGHYVYEGYRLEVVGGRCPCVSSNGPTIVDSEGAPQPCVDVSFSEPVVVFEDAYENRPGEWQSGRSTRSVLTIRAVGGARGGTMVVSSSNLYKLYKLSGPSVPTTTIVVPPGKEITYAVEYEGFSPSGAIGDVSVSACLTERFTNAIHSDSDSLTAVKVSLSPVYAAPQNPCAHRHRFGVGEKVQVEATPASVDWSLASTRIDPSETYYDKVDGSTYTCPITAASPQVRVVCSNVSYALQMQIVEPQEVVCMGARWDGGDLLPFQVGGAGMSLTNYVGPMDVSFRGIMVAEVPCSDPIPPTGYFAGSDSLSPLTHHYIFGEGCAMATRIESGNYWTVDRAAHPGAYQNWSEGRLEWKIPIGWFRLRYDSDDHRLIEFAERANRSVGTSRELLIGGGTDVYRQVFSISSDGTASVEKHGYRASRTRLGSESLEEISQ